MNSGISSALLVISVPILLLAAFLFTAAEVALFSLSRSQATQWRDEQNEVSRRLARMLDHPRKLLLTTIVGYNSTVALFFIVVVILAKRVVYTGNVSVFWAYSGGLLLAIPVVMLFGGIVPRLIAMSNPEKTARFLSGVIMLFFQLFSPLTTIFAKISAALARMFGIERERYTMSDSQLDALIEVEEQHEEINASEREMIRAVIDIREKPAREIMVPRIDLVAINVETTIAEARNVVRESMHSRIPVFEGTIDNIIGVLYAKDMLREIPENETLRNILREVYFVPDNKHVNDLLKEFQKKRLHLALVVDEYGGVAGVVTLEDILEEIIGEIQDEYDQEAPPVTKINDREWEVEGRLPVNELNETFTEEVIPESEDYDTVGGYLNSLAGRVPNTGDEFTVGCWRFFVKQRAENRVQSVRIQREAVVNEA